MVARVALKRALAAAVKVDTQVAKMFLSPWLQVLVEAPQGRVYPYSLSHANWRASMAKLTSLHLGEGLGGEEDGDVSAVLSVGGAWEAVRTWVGGADRPAEEASTFFGMWKEDKRE